MVQGHEGRLFLLEVLGVRWQALEARSPALNKRSLTERTRFETSGNQSYRCKRPGLLCSDTAGDGADSIHQPLGFGRPGTG